MSHGISFPTAADGSRPTSQVAREVVADALRPVDPLGARAAEQETAWRSRYLLHFRRLVEAGPGDARGVAAGRGAGLDAVRRRLVVRAPRRRPSAGLVGGRAGRAGARDADGDRRGRAADRAGAAVPRAAARGADLDAQLAAWERRGRARAVGGRRRPRGRRAPGVAAARGPHRRGARRRAPRWARSDRCCGGAPRVAAVDLPTAGDLAAGARHRPRGRRSTARPGGARDRGRRRRPARRGARRRPTGWRASTAGSWSATTSTPTAAPTSGSRSPSTRWPPRVTAVATRHGARLPGHADRRLRGARRGGRRTRPARTTAARAPPSCVGRPLRWVSRRPAAAPPATRPAPTRASTTAWCRSRAPTTRWPSGSSAGGRRVDAGRRAAGLVARRAARPGPARW